MEEGGLVGYFFLVYVPDLQVPLLLTIRGLTNVFGCEKGKTAVLEMPVFRESDDYVWMLGKGMG